MIQMTRQEYEQKYGAKPTASQPIQMTRAQYQAKYGQAPQQQQGEKSLSGFGSNVIKSAGENLTGMVSGIANFANPDMDKNTGVQIGRLAYGGLQKLDPTKDKVISKGIADVTPLGLMRKADEMSGKTTDYQPQADAVGNFYKERYGGFDKIGNTLYNDPVGVALDVSSLAGAGAGIAGATGKAGLANKLNTVSRWTDPVWIAGKGVTKITNPVTNKIKPLLSGVGDDLAVRAMQPSKGQLTSFQESTGIPFKDYIKSEGITGNASSALKQIQSKIKKSQKAYNSKVRTGKAIDPSEYANSLRQQAIDILESDRSPAARSVAESLWREAEAQERMGSLSDIVLTNTKSSQFNKVPGGVMSDPIAANFNKATGTAGIRTLEKIAPGSSAIGQKLQKARAFEDIVKNQANLSKGTQIFNTFKPAFAGLVTGAGAGSFIPGIGNVAGGLLGAGSAITLNNPKVMAMLAEFLQKAGKTSKTTSKNKSLNVFKKLYQAGKAERVVNPNSSW